MDLFASRPPDGDVGDPQVPGPGHTPPRVRAPRTGDPFDLADWDVPDPRRGSRRWLLAVAVVPWVVVVAVIVSGERTAAPAPAAEPAPVATGAASPTDDARPPTPSPAPPAGGAVAGDAVGSGTTVVLDGTTGPTSLDHARGVAVLVARSWLSTRPAGPPVEGLPPSEGADGRYVEHVAVEALDRPARGALVVTVRALVLPVEGDRYGTAEQVRLAVPLRVDAGTARPAGRPWRLPVEDLAVEPPETAPVDDPDLQLAAVDAIAAAGYRDVDLAVLGRTSGWAWVAEVTARAPGQDDRTEHHVWLRADVGRLVVAGTVAPIGSPRPPEATPPSPTPTDQEARP